VKGLLPALIDPTRAVDLTPLRDRRATAIALWIQGEREYRHAKFTAALQLYERALGDDSALALAAVKGAQAASWVHDFPRGLKLVALALQHDSLLPRRYAVFARGLNGYFTGNADSAAHWLREVVALDRGWSEAAAALGEVYYHLLPSDAPLDSLARAAFTAAIIADSGFAPPLFHLLEAQLRDGALPDADRLIQRFREMEPDPQLLLQISLMRECVAAPAAMPWRERVQRNAVSVLLAGKALTGGGHQFACAEGAFRSILSSPTTGRSERWGAFLGLQGILVATGRDREARVLVDSVAVRTGAARSLYVLATAAGARMAEPAAALDSFARQLYGERYERIPNAENLWVIGLWHHSQGNVAGLRVVDSTLRARALGTGNPRDRYFATAVNARVALSTDSARAIELLRGLTGALRGDVEWAIGEAVPADHLLLATLLLARGAHQDAIRAASVFDHAQPIMFLPYVPLSLAIRYRASMALGDEAAARRYRARLNGLHRGELLNN
ncbi:MAG TPA: hypothetical protein VLE53_04955, partial [Gemmatimonadaceae bacterium]|nr:hypothetical protein [Gemmatimonadaceae bacterium]